MAQNKKQHYLGQAYLKGFADRERRDAIWQYRASTKEEVATEWSLSRRST